MSDFMSDGDAQVKARVLCDHAAPVAGTGSAQLGHAPHQLVPVGQHQVVPVARPETSAREQERS